MKYEPQSLQRKRKNKKKRDPDQKMEEEPA